MTEEEFNRTLKELDVVLHDIDYNKFETSFDVAKFIITLNKINERMILEENEELKATISKMETLAENRGAFIDWCLEKYPEIVKEYNGFEKE